MTRKEAHKVKMEAKRIFREKQHANWPKPYIRANISQHHEDSGMSVADHNEAKAQRLLENNS